MDYRAIFDVAVDSESFRSFASGETTVRTAGMEGNVLSITNEATAPANTTKPTGMT